MGRRMGWDEMWERMRHGIEDATRCEAKDMGWDVG